MTPTFAAPCHVAAKTSSPIFFNPWLAFTRYQLIAMATYLPKGYLRFHFLTVPAFGLRLPRCPRLSPHAAYVSLARDSGSHFQTFLPRPPAAPFKIQH